MKGQKRCYSVRSKVTITAIKQFESRFSHPLPSQAQASYCSAAGQPGEQSGTRHHSPGCWLGSFSLRLLQGGKVPCSSSSHQRTELTCLCPEHTRTSVPNSFYSSQLHPIEAGIIWVRNQSRFAFYLSWARD